MASVISFPTTMGDRSDSLWKAWSREQGMIRGGRASHQWLCDHGFRGTGDELNARAAWELVERVLGVSWNLEQGSALKKKKQFVRSSDYPHVLGPLGEPLRPSLADLVRHCRNEISLTFVSWKDSQERALLPLQVMGEPGREFAGFIHRNGRNPSHGSPVSALADWLGNAVQGTPTTVLFFLCPDWEAQDGRYTFASLGSGVGLVARRALEILPELQRMMVQAGIPDFQIHFSIGDFEGDCPEVCARVGVDRAEFRRRCQASLDAFSRELDFRYPALSEWAEYSFVTDLAGGATDWHTLLQKAKERLDDGLETALRQSPQSIDAMVKARASLYTRWHGQAVDVRAILSAQLREYAAIGALARSFPNPLIVGVDHAVMASGFQALIPDEETLAVLYLRHDNY